MMKRIPHQDHSQVALQRLSVLYAEQQSIYRTALYRTLGLTPAEQSRLEAIAYEIALAYDECNSTVCCESLYGGKQR